VIIQIQHQYAPFVIGVHCITHGTNLSNIPLVSCIKNLLQCLYGYFNHNPKKYLEFTKLVEIMKIKGNKILWIYIISLVKCALFKYHILFMKMALNAPIIPFVNSNLSLLTNVDTLLGLNAMMLMLKEVHFLIKFAQLKYVFVCDFIVIVKICERDVYHMFCDRQSFFEGNVFNDFTTLRNIAHENISFYWITNLKLELII